MEERIRERYSEDILAQAVASYGIEQENVVALDGFESYIYQFSRDDQKGILRISHSIRRSPVLIRAELDWINYLHQGGVRVARPLQTVQRDWLNIIEDEEGGYFLVAAFDWAPGGIHRGDWPVSLLQEYGSQLGRMHRLAVDYLPPDPNERRAEWHDPRNLDFMQFLPEKDDKIRKISRNLLDYLHTLPKPNDGYGMIHQDPHPGNFHVDGNSKITFFDFDDCAYGWFVNDIALVLFYTAMGKEDPTSFISTFLKDFLFGYYQEFDLDPIWFQQIPIFQKLRELDLYALIHRSFDVDNLEDPWCAWYMDGRAEKLVAGKPFLDFDFGGFDYKSCR